MKHRAGRPINHCWVWAGQSEDRPWAAASGQWAERTLSILGFNFLFSVSPNHLLNMVICYVSSLCLPPLFCSPAQPCSCSHLLPGLKSRWVHPKPYHSGSRAGAAPRGLTLSAEQHPAWQKWLSPPLATQNVSFWRTAHKSSRRTTRLKQMRLWGFLLTTNPRVISSTSPHAFAHGEQGKKTQFAPATTTKGSTPAPLMEKGPCPSSTGTDVGRVVLSRAGADHVGAKQVAGGLIPAEPGPWWEPQTQCILRVKATIWGGRPPWKCSWQTVMAS